jgi:hypothetical protein
MHKLSRQDIASVEISWPETIREVERHINSEPAARAALDKLTKLGCDGERILKALYTYCGGTEAEVRAAKEDFGTQRRSILKLTAKLETTIVPEISEAEGILREAGFDVSSAVTAEAILAYAEFLKDLGNAVFGRPASGRVSGRDHHLRFIADMMKIVTGREHYAELAELIAAVRCGYTGDPGTVTATNIGKLVRRIRTEGPIEFEHSRELEELKRPKTVD